jgi:hypothetical protein
MATQIVTILKIAGVSGERVFEKVRQFEAERQPCCDPNCLIATEHWSADCRCRIDTFAEKLRKNRASLPVVFSLEYLDPWSPGPTPLWRLPTWETNAVRALGDNYWLECYWLPDEGRLLADLKKATRSKSIRERKPQENTWACVFLEEACMAWETLVDAAALVWMGQTVAASVDDSEIKAAMLGIPEWLKSGAF